MRCLMVTIAALLLPTLAVAGDPQISVGPDGTVVASMMVDATEATVKTTIPDVLQASKGFKNVLDVQITPDGTCRKVFRRTTGLWQPLEMYTRLCPTSQGWRERLVQSDDYDAYDVEWSVQPKDGRTEVRITVKSEVDLPVPSALVRQGAIGGIHETFAELLRRLVGAR
jgi:hypothetical protein